MPYGCKRCAGEKRSLTPNLNRCIGGRHTQHSRWTPEEYLRVTVDYTAAATRAFAAMMKRERAMTPAQDDVFRFVYCSGDASELVYNRSLWIMGPTRRAKVRTTLHGCSSLQRVFWSLFFSFPVFLMMLSLLLIPFLMWHRPVFGLFFLPSFPMFRIVIVSRTPFSY